MKNEKEKKTVLKGSDRKFSDEGSESQRMKGDDYNYSTKHNKFLGKHKQNDL
jgi:hypothetical protein